LGKDIGESRQRGVRVLELWSFQRTFRLFQLNLSGSQPEGLKLNSRSVRQNLRYGWRAKQTPDGVQSEFKWYFLMKVSRRANLEIRSGEWPHLRRDEYRAFLQKYGVKYEEKYLV
jgi:hypothetical protein